MTLQEIDNLCEYIQDNIEELKNIKRNHVEEEYKNIDTRNIWKQTTKTRDTIKKLVENLSESYF